MNTGERNGRHAGIRTPDLYRVTVALYQLSYAPTHGKYHMSVLRGDDQEMKLLRPTFP
jgi:hypothetical protein